MRKWQEVQALLPPVNIRSAAGMPPRASRCPRRTRVSSEAVLHLPGRIPIAYVAQLREANRKGDEPMYARFRVRGHWRRAQPDWTDQRVRWIEPYWKGPDMATIVEREYVLKRQ